MCLCMAQSLGDVFSAFAAALGAADKVIDMIQRRPHMPPAGDLQASSFSTNELLGQDTTADLEWQGT